MAQGYAERLVPAGGMNIGNSFMGDIRNREAWENAFNFRRRNNQSNRDEIGKLRYMFLVFLLN